MTNLTQKRDWKKAFLDSLSKSPNVTKAAKAAQFTRQRMYQLRDEDPAFAAEWDNALQEAMDNAEGETYRRAVKGTLKPVFHKGEEVGKIREYSDTLLMFWLKAHRPEKYRETVRNEMTGANGEPIKHEGTVKHEISGETATTIFDILATAGSFDAAPDDAKDDEIHTAHADT